MPADLDDRFAEYRSSGSRRLRNALVEEHLGYVEYYVGRFGRGTVEDDDVRQQAFLALIKAVERFDPGRGVGFKTFANRTIEGELKRLLRDKGWTVRPPRSMLELAVQARRVEPELAQELGRAVRVDDLAERLDESSDRILEALTAGGSLRADSLDAPVGDDGHTRLATLVGDSGDMVDVEDRLDVDALLATLDDRDRRIIEMRFVERRPQQEIADELGVSQSYLSRLLRRTLRDLRSELEGEADASTPRADE
ncbi:MAG: sigma-70 family RNA polymerase sigma factor [Acidimicrobiales bacterium]|nr:sigma-70 family RNA polymerase sigma factor [Acidimicrobiales bacterium]